MIVFSAIVPHSPLLHASISKEKQVAFQRTLLSYEELEKRLYLSKADTLIVITPHGAIYPESISANYAPSYQGSLRAFGNHDTLFEAKADTLLLDRLQRHLRKTTSFSFSSSTELDYGTTIPFELLSKHLPHLRLIPISISKESVEKHVEFGKHLSEVLRNENHRIAIIASADLSHHSSHDAPKGFLQAGADFDQRVRSSAKDRSIKRLLEVSEKDAESIGQCGLKTIAMLYGVLDQMQLHYEELSYETPFGVGQLVAHYRPK